VLAMNRDQDISKFLIRAQEEERKKDCKRTSWWSRTNLII